MARTERRSPVASGPLTNEEAAKLIGIILAETSTSAPPRPQAPDSLLGLEDLFPLAVLAR